MCRNKRTGFYKTQPRRRPEGFPSVQLPVRHSLVYGAPGPAWFPCLEGLLRSTRACQISTARAVGPQRLRWPWKRRRVPETRVRGPTTASEAFRNRAPANAAESDGLLKAYDVVARPHVAAHSSSGPWDPRRRVGSPPTARDTWSRRTCGRPRPLVSGAAPRRASRNHDVAPGREAGHRPWTRAEATMDVARGRASKDRSPPIAMDARRETRFHMLEAAPRRAPRLHI